MKLKIEKIIRREKSGQYGPYVSLSVLANGCWHNAVSKPWNQDWKEGDEIDIERQSKGEYKGAPTYKILPPGQAPQGQVDLKSVHEKLDKIISMLQSRGQEDVPPPTDEYYPGDDDVINESPF